MSLIAQKAQKLASAVYFITGFFPEQEPSKWKLRTLATELVSERIPDKSSVAREIVMILGLAKTAGLISEVNSDILMQELAKLEKEAEEPLRQLLSSELPVLEKGLPEPQVKIESIKDKIPQEKPLKEFGVVSVKKNSRQSIIIGLLKRKKEIMIKDVSSLIEDCSEKTLQRELLTMVSQGILKKIGEKRWSKYSLA